jgi:hypothetical protein
MYEEHRMLPIALLSSALTSSVDVDLVGQAYVTSQTTIRFLEAKYGARIIPSLLTRLRDGQSEDVALAELTGKSLDRLESEFREWGRSEHRAVDNKAIIRYDTNPEYKPMVRFSKQAPPSR